MLFCVSKEVIFCVVSTSSRSTVAAIAWLVVFFSNANTKQKVNVYNKAFRRLEYKFRSVCRNSNLDRNFSMQTKNSHICVSMRVCPSRSGQGSSFIHFIPGRQPNNTYVKEGEMVSCYCEYSGTESLPYWRVNETDYSVSSVPVTAGFIANASGLFFEARLEMDSTNFQCFFTIYKSGQFQPVESSIGTVFVEEGQCVYGDCCCKPYNIPGNCASAVTMNKPYILPFLALVYI